MKFASSTVETIIHLPYHIAFIMDGNGRWAQKRGLPRIEGHRVGVENLRSVIERLYELQIKYVTVYGLSTENWKRPEEEIISLLHLIEEIIGDEMIALHKRGIRLRHLGRLDGLSPRLQESITRSVALTQNNTGMVLSFAFNYGGRIEILDAVRQLIIDGIPPKDIDENLFTRYLYTAGLPEIDLVIRTGGELRISNFLIWQAAYSEFYFTKVLWPDFNKQEVEKALLSYSQRQRRFGGL
jgi:undecaprenyl diphosphate synthase